MDDQKSQDQNDDDSNSEQPISTPINDMSPPPVEENIGQKINVVVGSGESKMDEKSDNNDRQVVEEQTQDSEELSSEETDQETKVEPVEESTANSEEQLAPVTPPPDNTNSIETENSSTEAVQENSYLNQGTDNSIQQGNATQDAPQQAAVGVAASQMNKHPHRNNKKLATIVTIVTALILAGVAVFVYMSANKNTDSDNSETTQINGSSYTEQETVKQVAPATAEDIDQTISEVEESLSTLDDSADFNEASLSNDTLGL